MQFPLLLFGCIFHGVLWKNSYGLVLGSVLGLGLGLRLGFQTVFTDRSLSLTRLSFPVTIVQSIYSHCGQDHSPPFYDVTHVFQFSTVQGCEEA